MFFACPATGQVSWDPPAGTFVCVIVTISNITLVFLTGLVFLVCLQAPKESGGSSAMSLVVESPTIIKQNRERPSGNVQTVLSFPSPSFKFIHSPQVINPRANPSPSKPPLVVASPRLASAKRNLKRRNLLNSLLHLVAFEVDPR